MWRNGKRFPCPDCHKTFATQVDLKAHLMRHITQHPYVCFACGKGFKYDHTLDFHIKSQHGAENGTGNTSTGSSGKNESFNLKSLNRKSCKMKREMVDDKSGSSVISGVGLFGIGSATGIVSGSGSGIGIGTGLDNQNNNRALNNSSSIGERNKQQRRDQPLIGRLREMDDPIGNTNVKHNKNNKARENCDDQSFNGGISSDIISQHQHHNQHNQHNQPQHVLTNNPLQIPGSLIEPNSILNGLKFPISLSSYPSSCTTTASHTSTLNSIPFVPTTLLPSSGSTLTSSSLPSSVSSPSLIPSLASSLLTSSTSTTTSTATIAKTTTPITTSTANKEKMSSIAANTSNLASNLPLIDFGLQGDLSPRNLQIKSEKVLISVLEGVHPVNEQTYSLYKCCLCGFAFPSLEPVSIHIQSLHSNNLNLTCDKCGATFKWKSELQLHEQLHKAMDQSVNNFILNNGEEIDSNNNNNNSNSDCNNNNNNSNNSNSNIKNQNVNNNVNNIKSKSQLQNHHSLQNQLKQDHNHPHLQKQLQLQLQLQQLQQHQHQQQSQQSSRSLIMPSFFQPNLVFMNQYLNSDDHKIGNDNDDIRRRSNIGIKEEDEGNEGMNQEDADEESKCDQDENIDEDDGQGLNLSLKPQYKTKVEDVNPSYDKNNSMMMSMMMMRKKNNNLKLNNNINNENDENNNNGHDRMTSMDEPIDLKIESFSDSNNNNINNLGNNIISNSLNFLHSSLLPSSMGLSFPPMPSSSSSTSAAQASAAAAAAAVFAKNIAPKQSQLHQQNIGGLNSFQLQNIGPSNVSRSISSPSSSSLSTGTISSVSSSGGAALNSGNVNVNVNGIGNIGMGKITEPIGDIEETAPGQFKCRFCDKTFDRIFSVHRHERVHTGYKPCICKECGRGFSEKRNLRHHTIRFHSDGSGRELLKRNRKEKSMASAASFLKKAAVRLLSNSSVEGSAMEEDDIMSNRLTSDNNNNNINISINSNNNNNGDDGKNDMKNCSSNYNYKNNDNTDGSKDDEFDQRSRISDDISGNTDNYNSTFNCNDKDDNNNNNNNNGDEADADHDNNNVNYYNNYHHKQMNVKRMNRKNNNNICDKEMGSDANGDSNIEDNIGDKICLNSSSLSSSSSLSLSLSLSSSSRRRKSKPSKKISNNIESGDKSDEECEADENVGIKEEAKEMEEDFEGDEDDEEDAEVDDEREEGYRHGHGYRQGRGHGHGQRDGNERERNEEDVNGNEDEDGDDDSMMITGDEEAVGLIDDDYNDDKNNNNNNNTNNDNNSMERRNGENGDEKVNDSIDNINNRKNIENDLNGSVNGNNNNHNLHEGKLRLHGAFFSNYSPRLALVDKVTKRGESSRPMIGPDGRYLYSYL